MAYGLPGVWSSSRVAIKGHWNCRSALQPTKQTFSEAARSQPSATSRPLRLRLACVRVHLRAGWFCGLLAIFCLLSQSRSSSCGALLSLHEACPRTQAIPEARSEKVGLLGAGATASAVTREQRTPVRACPGCHQRLACRA